MKTATLQGLLGRKMRTALTALSIVLGVAMVSGTFILTDTMKKAFDDLFQGTYKNAGAVISGKEIVKGAAKSTVPESLQTKVAALPDVESASGADLRHQRHKRLRQADRPRRQAARERPAAELRLGLRAWRRRRTPRR